MFFQFGIVCASAAVDLKEKERPSTEAIVDMFERSLTSVDLLGEFLDAIESANDSVVGIFGDAINQ
jgi:hypothetical protein